jgi:alkylhydroperoxidase/carboxymuconolactone decarboxylase family protein YurZ
MSTAMTTKQKELREQFIEARGYWNEFWDSLLSLDEDFFAAYLDFSSVPWRKGPLEPKVKELIYIAVDAAATHLYEPGIRQHVKQALELGATREEIMEVLELTATLGIHACNIGVPILVEELEAAGKPIDRSLSERQLEVKKDFEENRGYWNPFWDEILFLDPEFFDTYTRFSSVPWVSGVLEPKVKELIYTAFDVAATHLYVKGLRAHIRNALGYGATREEVLEVIEIASVIGIHSCTVGVPILVEELAAAGTEGESG